MQLLRHWCLAIAVLAGLAATAIAAEPVALTRAHAHNDYLHPRPLLDALDHGFNSVEADIFLINGRLLVAHNRADVRPERTLEALYLDPLRERVQANGGRVHRDRAEFWLMIDIKEDGVAVYEELKRVLARYDAMLTHFTDTNTVRGAVTVVLSGDRPADRIRADARRLCGIDGKLADLDANSPAHLVPWISDNWRAVFGPFTDGKLSDADREKLRGYVRRAHEQGRLIRFWGVADRDYVWRELYDAGVDLLNTDQLDAVRDFLLERRSKPGR